MFAHLYNLYAYILGRPILAKFHYRLLYLSARALGLLNYASSNLSGEKRTIDLILSGKVSPIVFDVGANEGKWLSEVISICPSARIHAFEPQKRLADSIAIRYPLVTISNKGLADKAGFLELYDYAEQSGSTHASFLEGVIDDVHHGVVKSEKVLIDTVDNYCAEQKIDRIDFLKIDVEGFEFRVLQGAQRMLEAGKIEAIQFEFNEMNVVGRVFMRDFILLLSPTYRLHRLLPHGMLPLRQEEFWMNEQFVFQNILALREKK